MTIGAEWRELLPAELIEQLDRTVFLSRCRSGEVTRAELERFLVQQHHYSKHFTRYLCALMGNLENEGDRQALIENLLEEMGYGDAPGADNEPHSKIYRDMLGAFGLNPSDCLPSNETQALVATMLNLCSSTEPMRGLGALCLGAEAIVPHVYTQILGALVKNGFAEKDLRFFTIHIDCDDGHALTMKAIIDRALRERPEAAAVLLESARECIARRADFFNAISRGARVASPGLVRAEPRFAQPAMEVASGV